MVAPVEVSLWCYCRQRVYTSFDQFSEKGLTFGPNGCIMYIVGKHANRLTG